MLSSSFLSYILFHRLFSAVAFGCLPYFHTWCGLSAILGCRSEMCCTWLAENTVRQKIRHLPTIAQLCRAISMQLRHVSTIGKNVLYSNISPTCPYNITARHSSSGRWPKFVALNIGATYIRQGGHHFGYWPIFQLLQLFFF